MLVLALVSTIVYLALVPFYSPAACSVHYTRTSVMVFLLCLAIGTFLNVESVDLYHSLFNYSSFTTIIDSLLYLIAALVLINFSPRSIFVDTVKKGSVEEVSLNQNNSSSLKPEYSLILMFSILGASIMISANDVISIYVALELQSFGLYLLACLRTEETGSTHASLKYFLLGAISSAFILLGISIIYQETGSTQFQNISSFLLAITQEAQFQGPLLTDQNLFWGEEAGTNNILTLGILSMLCGFMFKISAAPFHSWFADVIQEVPTYTSIVIINLPKISIFTFLFNMFLTVEQGGSFNTWTSFLPGTEMFLVLTTLFSLVLGTVAGLIQTKFKRLLAFSTISHVGFILIGLTAQSEVSLSAIIFYLLQYTLTVVLTFLVLVTYENSGYAYALSSPKEQGGTVLARPFSPINYIVDLQGIGQTYKLLTFTLVLCLFSMAGIPPITGFYAKLGVLNASIMENMSIVFLTAIVCSIISAAYYLKVIKVLMFNDKTSSNLVLIEKDISDKAKEETQKKVESKYPTISPVESYVISIITAFLCLFILDSQVVINCTQLVALSMYLL